MKPRPSSPAVVGFGLWLALTSCAPQEVPQQAEDGAIASYRGGSIGPQDLDQAVLALPSEQRLALNADDLEPFRQIVRGLVFDRALLEEARQQGLDRSPEAVSESEGLRRQALAAKYLEENLPKVREPGEDELAQLFEQRSEGLHQPEARSVFHLFRRAAEGQSTDPLVIELQGFRQRVMRGENFSLLAAEHSDSESRHQQGFIGRIVPRQLPAEFDQVVFSLEEKVPSEPVVTREGVHLFFVESIIPARQVRFEEMRSNLRREIIAAERAAAASELLAAIEFPPDSFVPQKEELEALLTAGDPAAVVLRLGDFQIELGKYQRLVAQEEKRLPASRKLRLRGLLPGRVLEALVQREKAVLAATEAGLTLSPETEERLAEQAELALLDRYRRQLVERRLDGEGERIRTFYESNRKRFSSPLSLRLRILTTALDAAASDKMAQLEALQRQVEAGTTEFGALPGQVGGEIAEPGWQRLDQLTAADPKMALFAGRLREGGVSPPFVDANGNLAIFQVIERREPEVVALEEAMGAVRTAFVQRYGRELYDELITEKLESVDFVLAEAELAKAVHSWAHGSAGAPAQDPATGEE